jgi:hypothetical protein
LSPVTGLIRRNRDDPRSWRAFYYSQGAAVITKTYGCSNTLWLPGFMLKLRPVAHVSCVLHPFRRLGA